MRYIIPLVDGVYTEGDASITTEGTRNESSSHKIIVALNGAPSDGKLTIQYKRAGSNRWDYVDYTNLSEVEPQKIEISGVSSQFRFIVEGASGTGTAIISDTELGESITPYGLFGETNGMTPEEIGGAIELFSSFENTGAWVTATDYTINQLWSDGGNWYLVLEDYTSGASAAADIAGGTVAQYEPSGRTWQVYSIAQMEALTPLKEGQAVYLSAGGRSGTFHWDGSDLSTEVAADTLQGVYVAPASDATGASGAWVRKLDGKISVDWFGADTTGSVPFDAEISSARDVANVVSGVVVGTHGARYLLSSPFDFENVEFDLGGSLIIIGDNISTTPGDVAIRTGTVEFSAASFRECTISIDGNEANQTVDIVAFNIYGDRSPLSTYRVKGDDCGVVCLVDGSTERSEIHVHGNSSRLLYREFENVSNESPDENSVYLYGATCEKWYECEGQVSSKVNFAVESSIDASNYAVEVRSGKAVTLAGEIRATNGDCILLNDSGSTGTVIFDDLNVIQVSGKAITVEDMSVMTGKVYVENYDDTALDIDYCQSMGGFELITHNANSAAGLHIRNISAPAVMEDTSFTVSIDGANASGEAVIIESAQQMEIYALRCRGDIRTESGCNRVSVYVNSDFLDDGYEVVNNAGAGNFYLHVRGNVNFTDLYNNATSWAFNGVYVDYVRAIGAGIEWRDSGWVSGVPIGFSQSDFENAASNANVYHKAVGGIFRDISNNRFVSPSGTGATSTWLDMSGTLIYTPT